MTNEIKEILNKLIEYRNSDYECKQPEDCLTIEDVWLLLDYITNLQEEIKEWEMIFDTFSRRPYAHRYLEEKRKELNNDKIVGLDSESIYKDYYNLKQRIGKAIELIEKYGNGTFDEDLLNILQGDE